MATWTPFKLVATLSSPQPGRPGLIHVRPKIGKASATFYLDPQIELTPASAAPSATHKSSRYAYEGTETTETSIVRSGGTAHSRRIVTTANSQWLRPYRAEPYAVWNDTTGADVTVTVHGSAVGALPLSDEIFMDVEYLNSTHGTIVSTSKANVLATGASVATDVSAVWAGTAVERFDASLSAEMTLSADGLRGTRYVTALSYGGVRSSNYRNTGKFYLEFTMEVITGSTIVMGLGVSTLTYGNFFTGNFAELIVAPDGSIWNGANTGYTLGSIASAGSRVQFAVDLTARLGWLRRNGAGNWNGALNGDPVAGTGGVAIPAGAMSAAIAIFTANHSASVNFGPSFTYAVPTGFSVWGTTAADMTPFKLVATLNGTPVTTAATWDPATTTAVTLSGGNLVTTNTGTTSVDQGARAPLAAQRTSGKIYFEVTLTTAAVGNNIGVGVGAHASTYTGMGQSGGVIGAMSFFGSGNIYSNGVFTGKTHAASANIGIVFGVAVNLDTREIWFKRYNPGGEWNGVVGGNPVTGAGPVALPTGAMVPFVTFGGISGAAGNILTANFGQSAFYGTVPAGYEAGWNATTIAGGPGQPGQPGLINVRVKAAKPSATYYLDPTPVLT